MGHILSIDQGTTGTTAFIIDTKNYEMIGKSNREFPQIYPTPGQVEHNLNDIWDTVKQTIQDVLRDASLSPENIQCIGITNQRETTCAFSKSTGKPLANAIVWQDRRTHEVCQNLRSKNFSDLFTKKTGLPLDPYFSATKMQWLLQNSENIKTALNKDDLLFGTIDTFLLYNLSGMTSYFTEASNASRTLLMNLESGNWDDELLDIFHIQKRWLPEIKNSFGEFGKTKGLDFLPDGIPITGILGDQQSALFGQAGIYKGDMKCTYGTGAFMLLNTGTEIKYSNAGLLTTVAYRHHNKLHYALEGSSYIAGAAVQWLRDNLKIIETSEESEDKAALVKNLDEMKNLLFLPFFAGIGSPYWKSDVQAAIVGITRDTNQNHLTRACLDGICLSINDLIKAMEKDINSQITSLKVDGGAVANNLLMTIQATISELNIIRPKIIETTAYGAALAAAIGANMITIDQTEKLWKIDKSFSKNLEWSDFYKKKYQQWTNTIKKLFLD